MLTTLAALVLSACGSGEMQDANEPSGEFEVKVTTSKFPSNQRLAREQRLILGVENLSDETIPELTFNVFTDEGDAQGSFNIRSNQPNLANPSRPVWILEDKFPREVGDDAPLGSSPGVRAQSNTFGFGPLEAGETKKIVWKVTSVRAGTFTLNYVVSAGLDGKAKAVTTDGGEVKGEFVVTITEKTPKTRVNDAGEVVEGTTFGGGG